MLRFASLASIGPVQRLPAVMGDGEDLNACRRITTPHRKRDAIETSSAYIARMFNAITVRVLDDACHHGIERIQIGAAQPGPTALVEHHGCQMSGSRFGVKVIAQRSRAWASRRTASAEIGDSVPASSCCARRWASSSQAVWTCDSDNPPRLKSSAWASSARLAGASAKACRTRLLLSMTAKIARRSAQRIHARIAAAVSSRDDFHQPAGS